MKKIILVFSLVILNILPSFAKNGNYLYVVKDSSLSSYSVNLQKKLNGMLKDNTIYSMSNDFYYFKLYQVGEDINLFLICDTKNQATQTALLKSLNSRTYLLTDKDLTKNYLNDFDKFIYTNNIQLTGYKTKDNSYNAYDKKLKNEVLRTTQYQENNINFVIKKLLMKSKIKKYVNGYEVSITNNTGKNIILKKASSGDFVGLTEIAKKAVIPQGIDFVPIYGIVAGAKTDLEKNRFTRPFPIDYPLKDKETVKILGLSKILVEPIVDFTFEIDGKDKNIQLHTYK